MDLRSEKLIFFTFKPDKEQECESKNIMSNLSGLIHNLDTPMIFEEFLISFAFWCFEANFQNSKLTCLGIWPEIEV